MHGTQPAVCGQSIPGVCQSGTANAIPIGKGSSGTPLARTPPYQYAPVPWCRGLIKCATNGLTPAVPLTLLTLEDTQSYLLLLLLPPPGSRIRYPGSICRSGTQSGAAWSLPADLSWCIKEMSIYTTVIDDELSTSHPSRCP